MTELFDKYLSEASNVFECDMMKVTAFVEAAGRQLAINHNEAELKVMKENGTDDDLNYLWEAADKSFVQSAVAAIKKIQEAIVKFFQELRDKILNLLAEKDIKGTLTKIENKMKMLPLINKKKTVMEDAEAAEKACDEAEASLAKLVAKKKAGQDVKTDDVAEVEKTFMEKHGKAIGVASAITVAVGALLLLLKKKTGTVSQETKAIEAATSKDLALYTTLATKSEEPSDVTFYQAVARTRARIGKERGNDKFRFIKNAFSKVKEVLGFKFVNPETGDTERKVGKGVYQIINKKQESVEEASQDGVTPAPEESEAAVKAAADAVAKEEGPVEDADPLDALDKIDPWSSVMDGLDVTVPVAGAECGPEGCDTECGGNGCNENATDSFDALYKKIFGDAAPNPSDPAALPGGKPNNDKMIADLYKDVMAEVMVKGKNPEVKPIEPLKEGIGVESAESVEESAFDTLMKEIEMLV